MAKAVFFDLGDTLIRVPERYREERDFFVQSQLEKLGYKRSMIEIKEAREKTWKHIETRYRARAKEKYDEALVPSTLFKNLGVKIDRDQIMQMEREREKVVGKSIQLMPNAKEILEYLRNKGYELVMVTNNSTRWANHLLDRFDLRKYFDHVVVSEEVGEEKSTTLPFKVALERTGLKPEDVVVVGDRSDEDVYGAKMLGMKAVRIRSSVPVFGETREADHEIEDLKELKKIL